MLRWILATVMMAMLACGSSASVQVVAWAGMLVSRTVEQGWTTAVDTTFDGNHPCSMCLAAASLKQVEAGSLPQRPEKGDPTPIGKSVKKIDSPVASFTTLGTSATDVAVLTTVPPVAMGPSFCPSPELPPPRS
jgi:hypothetical protein